MTHKCSNPYCGYGRDWGTEKAVSTNAKGHIALHDRADAYCQNEDHRTYRKANDLPEPYYGLCLNCIADHNQEADMSEGVYPITG